MSSGVWYIPQGGTGLSSVTNDCFLTTNSSGLFETTVAIPLPINKGGTGLTSLNASAFLTSNALANGIDNTKAIPTGAVVGDTDTQTLSNKTISSSTITALTSGLTVPNGGTGVTTIPANSFLIGNGTSAITTTSGPLSVSLGGTGAATFTSGNVLTGNGTLAVTATKAAPNGDFVGTTDTQTISGKTFDTTTFSNLGLLMYLGPSSGNQYAVSSTSPSGPRTYSITDMGVNTDFAFTSGTQSLTNKTITDSSNTVSGSSLKTASGNVDVGSSTAPVANQTLVATSGTTATWQTLVPTTFNVWTAISTVTLATASTSAQTITGATGVGSLTLAANTLDVGGKIVYNIMGSMVAAATTNIAFLLQFTPSNTLVNISSSVFTITTGTVGFKIFGTLTCTATGGGGALQTDYTCYRGPMTGGVGVGVNTATVDTTAAQTFTASLQRISATAPTSWTVTTQSIQYYPPL